jgi:hypothetical protein
MPISLLVRRVEDAGAHHLRLDGVGAEVGHDPNDLVLCGGVSNRRLPLSGRDVSYTAAHRIGAAKQALTR